MRGGLELVPARSHKPFDVGSNPIPATKFVEVPVLWIDRIKPWSIPRPLLLSLASSMEECAADNRETRVRFPTKDHNGV